MHFVSPQSTLRGTQDIVLDNISHFKTQTELKPHAIQDFRNIRIKLVPPFVQSKEPFTGTTEKHHKISAYTQLRRGLFSQHLDLKQKWSKSSPSGSTEAGHFPGKEEFAASKFQWILLKVEQYWKEKKNLATITFSKDAEQRAT